MKTPGAFICLLFSFAGAALAADIKSGFKKWPHGRPAASIFGSSLMADAGSEEAGSKKASPGAAETAGFFLPAAAGRAIQSAVKISLIQPEADQKKFEGTGFLIGENLVATNFHVISQMEGLHLRVQSNAGGQLPFLRISRLSALSDLAVLEVENPEGAPYLSFGPPQKRGDAAFIFGFLKNERLPRKIQGKALAEDSSESLLISPPDDMGGFSGAPIVDKNGRLVGVFSGNSHDIASGIPAAFLKNLLRQPPLPPSGSSADLIGKEMTSFKNLAARGEARALQRLGLALFHGLGAPKDLRQARLCFQAAAEQGLPESQYSLGLMLLKETGRENAAEEAFRWFLKAAEQGYIRAQYQAGIMLSQGAGTKKDLEKSLEWFERAAEGGLPLAQTRAANMRLGGLGAPPSIEKAFKLFLAAAKGGQIQAQSNVGVMYLEGWGTEKNLKEAYYWLWKAANQGEAVSQRNIGLMYLHGIYLEKDIDKARRWLSKAAAQGLDSAEFTESLEAN